MSFYLRKAVRVGPFRFNLSKSGIGVSTGIKGLRVGTGPNGNYVHMGRGGIYYRKSLSSSPKPEQSSSAVPSSPAQEAIIQGDVVMQAIDSADVSRMTHSSSTELLAEISAKQKKLRIGPLALIGLFLVLATLIATDQSIAMTIIVGIMLAPFVVFGFYRDILAKTTVLLFDIDSSLQDAYSGVHRAALALASCKACWHISAAGAVGDSKYHAGASTLIDRKPTSINRLRPPFLKTNIDTISIAVGRQKLYFFPDRVLLYDSGRIGAIGYDQLILHVSQTPFIESGSVPSDAEIIEKTWQYVNKKGGPDKRFANNRELPICRYEDIRFSSTNGLNEIIQLSRCSLGSVFQQSILTLSEEIKAASNSSARTIRIARNGEDMGEHSLSTVLEMIEDGSLTNADYFLNTTTNEWESIAGLKI